MDVKQEQDPIQKKKHEAEVRRIKFHNDSTWLRKLAHSSIRDKNLVRMIGDKGTTALWFYKVVHRLMYHHQQHCGGFMWAPRITEMVVNMPKDREAIDLATRYVYRYCGTGKSPV